MRCYIFDLDGTLCDISHRLHYIKTAPGDWPDPETWKPDWDAFFAACVGDKPIEPICALARSLAQNTNVLFVSGRSDAVREQTQQWLRYNVLPSLVRSRLYMRQDGDHRPDHIVKAEMLDRIVAEGWHVIMAFDDRKQVVDMWRSRGIICAQVAEGDF